MNPLKLDGGLDLSTPAPMAEAGTLRDCLNYEVATRDGYSRILGVERFDGGPGVAQFKVAQFGMSSVIGEFTNGEPVSYGEHEGHIIDLTTENGITYATVAMEGGGYILQDSDDLVGIDSGAVGFAGTVRIVFTPRGRQDLLQESLAKLANARRAQKQMVPGRVESDVLATFMLRNTVYAVRDLPRVYFEGGYYLDEHEGLYVTINGLQYLILDVRITGDENGYIIYDPLPGSGPAAVPIGDPVLSTLPVSGELDDGWVGVPYSDGLVVSGGLPPYTWTMADADTGPEPAPEIGDLSDVRFLSEQTPAALWRAIATGGWSRVPGGREMQFTNGTELADINTRALNIDASMLRDTGWLTPDFVELNGDAAAFPVNMGSGNGTTLVARDFGVGADMLAGAQILGIEVEVTRLCPQAGRAHDLGLTLVGLIGQPDNKSAGPIPTTATAVTYGSATDLWGIENITADDTNATVFGIVFAVQQDLDVAAANTTVTGVRMRVHYALRGGMRAWIWDGTTDIPIVINASLPSSGEKQDNNLAGYFNIEAPTNSGKPRLVVIGDEIRTAPAGAGELIAKAASRDRPIFLSGQLELDTNRSRYQFIQTNFYGQDKFDAVYGVSGAGPAFCFDGTNITKIRTPLSPQDDLPRHIARHGECLGLGFFGGALLLTPPGNPFEVRGELGATAIEVGDRIMALTPMSGDALGILCQSQSVLLRGLTELSYFKSTLSARRGALEYTSADMGNVVVADSFGLFLAESPESYASAERNYLSVKVEEWLRERLQATLNTEQRFLRPVAALAVRAKNQYRLFFRDGYIMTLTQKETGPQFTLQRYYAPTPDEFSNDTPWAVRALASGIDASGRERLFCSFTGVKAGYVFEIEGGNTLDGDTIPHFIELNPITPGVGAEKFRYDKVFIYGSGRGYAPLKLHRSVDYFSNTLGDAMSTLLGRMDAPATISNKPLKGMVDVAIEGEEISMRFLGDSGADAPHTLQYLKLYSDGRGDSRGNRGE